MPPWKWTALTVFVVVGGVDLFVTGLVVGMNALGWFFLGLVYAFWVSLAWALNDSER